MSPIGRKKTLITAFIAVCAAVIVLIAVFMPSRIEKTEVSEEIISKRAKIEPQAPEPAPQAQAVADGAKQTAARPESEAAKTPETAKEPSKAKATEKAVKKEAVKEKPEKTVKAEKAAPVGGGAKERQKTIASGTAAAKSKPWALNIASYTDEGPAKGLAASLRSAGYNAYTTVGRKNGRTWHRVRVGFYRTREDAEKAGKAIEKKFNVPSVWVVKPPMNETAGHISR